MFLALADSRFEGESTLLTLASNASRWALYSDDFGFFQKNLVPVTCITWKAVGDYDELFQETIQQE